jgi:UDP-N-acetylmuramate dehydrogenase
MGFFEELKSVTRDVLINEPMSRHTTLRIGGPADYFVSPASRTEAEGVLAVCRQWGAPCYPLGNGSNTLFLDGGFKGVVLSVLRLKELAAAGCKVTAGAGVSLKDFSAFCASLSLAGAEFACGIPGSVGGAVYMNAGAYDSEMSRIVECVEAIGVGGAVNLSNSGMAFGYRRSAAQSLGLLITGAVFALSPGDGEASRARIDELNAKRADKQPIDMASAGSAFKRPEGRFAGALIMDSGLRGFSVGGAAVSEKHCGFLINKGGASAADILALIRHIQEKVFADSGVWLEPEVRIAGGEKR